MNTLKADFYIYIYLSALMNMTLDECHAWFHLYGNRRVVRNEKQAKNSQWNYMSPIHSKSNQRPLRLAFQYDALENSATLMVDEICFKLLHYFGMWMKSRRQIIDFGLVCSCKSLGKETHILSDSQFQYTSRVTRINLIHALPCVLILFIYNDGVRV